MNVTNAQIKAIQEALDLLQETGNKKKRKQIIENACNVMKELQEKKRKVNERTKNYINEKRKTNKNYARTPYVKKADREAEKETGKKTKRNKKTK